MTDAIVPLAHDELRHIAERPLLDGYCLINRAERDALLATGRAALTPPSAPSERAKLYEDALEKVRHSQVCSLVTDGDDGVCGLCRRCRPAPGSPAPDAFEHEFDQSDEFPYRHSKDCVACKRARETDATPRMTQQHVNAVRGALDDEEQLWAAGQSITATRLREVAEFLEALFSPQSRSVAGAGSQSK